MATPSRPNPAATPTHLTSSPHPSAVPMGRGLSHKSPSIIKTPSASGTAHGHYLSTSSHQGATPLTATAGLDDPVSLSSPSALLALGGFTGMTPALNGQDGLVGSGINDSDIRALTLGLGGSRNHEEERRKRIEEVVRILRGRVAGRGVSREAVERLGRLEGFESIWQDDSLSIAGNSVDLEIEFHPGEDNVKDVSLSYASLEGEIESERRDEATSVLKGDLIQTPEERANRVWKPLRGFQSNLERLAKLDHLSQEINCFEAVEGLFESLQKVWDAEKKRGNYHSEYDHICRGSIGRPSLHKRGRVGMGLEYWIDGHRILSAKQGMSKSEDSMAIDIDENSTDMQERLRSVTIECEEGFPSLRISREWVGTEVLSTVGTDETSNSTGTIEVNWVEPPPTLQSSISELDPGMGGSQTANRRFVAKLEPHVHVPLLVANDIYRHLGLTMPQEYRTTTYDDLLVSGWTSGGVDSNESLASEPLEMPEKRRRTTVLSFDEKNEPVQRNHSYSFQAFEAAPGMTIREFPFSHPRQLADIFPILRQYSLLAMLMQKVFPRRELVKRSDHESKGSSKTSDTLSMSGNSTSTTEQISILSNGDVNEDLLDSLLREGADSTGTISLHNDSQIGDENEVRVDMTLRTQVGQAPLIILSITQPETRQKASVSFEIRPNGRVKVVQGSGLTGSENASDQSMDKVYKKLNRVLEVSEDLSILVEYVVSQLCGMS